MMSNLETGPSYPVSEGSKISGDPAEEVDGQGLPSGHTTGPSTEVVPEQAASMDNTSAPMIAQSSNSPSCAYDVWLREMIDSNKLKWNGFEYTTCAAEGEGDHHPKKRLSGAQRRQLNKTVLSEISETQRTLTNSAKHLAASKARQQNEILKLRLNENATTISEEIEPIQLEPGQFEPMEQDNIVVLSDEIKTNFLESQSNLSHDNAQVLTKKQRKEIEKAKRLANLEVHHQNKILKLEKRRANLEAQKRNQILKLRLNENATTISEEFEPIQLEPGQIKPMEQDNIVVLSDEIKTNFLASQSNLSHNNAQVLTKKQRKEIEEAKRLANFEVHYQNKILKIEKRRANLEAQKRNQILSLGLHENMSSVSKEIEPIQLELGRVEPMKQDNTTVPLNKIVTNLSESRLNLSHLASVESTANPDRPRTTSYYKNNFHAYRNRSQLAHFIEPPGTETRQNQVEGNLKVLIVDRSQKYGLIQDQNRSTLEVALTASVDEALCNGNITPKFLWHGCINGKFRIACQDMETLYFLKKTVKHFGKLWYGAQLHVVDNTQKIQATVWVPGEIYEPDILLRRISRQNNINIMKWKLLDFNVKPGSGQLLVIAIDDESAKILSKSMGLVNCGLTTVTMKLEYLIDEDSDDQFEDSRNRPSTSRNRNDIYGISSTNATHF